MPNRLSEPGRRPSGQSWVKRALLALMFGSLLLLDAVQPGRAAGFSQILAESTFDSDADGWRVTGDADPSYGVLHRVQGGNPGGHIAARDSGQRVTWYWVAPSRFVENAPGALRMSFELKQSQTDSPFAGTGDVVLIGAGFTLVHKLDQHPGRDWTSYSVLFDRADRWLKIESLARPTPAVLATQDEIAEALASLTALWIRGEYRNGEDTGSLDSVRLYGVHPDAVSTAAVEGESGSLRVDLFPLSVMVGEIIDVLVYYVNAAGRPIAVDGPVEITLEAHNGELLEPVVRLGPGDRVAQTALRGAAAGGASIEAEDDSGSRVQSTTAYSCASGEANGFDLIANRARAPLGVPIELTVRLMTSNGTMVRSGSDRAVSHVHGGVGRWLESGSDVIASDECAAKLLIVSDEPGIADVTIEVGNLDQEKRSYEFFVTVLHLQLAAVAAGVAGGLVRGARGWPRSRHWSAVRWVVESGVGAVAGLLLFLVARFGLITVIEEQIVGWEVAIALGLIGGYLGPTAFDRIADRLLPPARQD